MVIKQVNRCLSPYLIVIANGFNNSRSQCTVLCNNTPFIQLNSHYQGINKQITLKPRSGITGHCSGCRRENKSPIVRFSRNYSRLWVAMIYREKLNCRSRLRNGNFAQRSRRFNNDFSIIIITIIAARVLQ